MASLAEALDVLEESFFMSPPCTGTHSEFPKTGPNVAVSINSGVLLWVSLE